MEMYNSMAKLLMEQLKMENLYLIRRFLMELGVNMKGNIKVYIGVYSWMVNGFMVSR